MFLKFLKWFKGLFKKKDEPVAWVVRVDYLGRSTYYVKGFCPHSRGRSEEYYTFERERVTTYNTRSYGTGFSTYEEAEGMLPSAVQYYLTESDRISKGFYVEKVTCLKK